MPKSHASAPATTAQLHPVLIPAAHPADVVRLTLNQPPAAIRPHWPRRELIVTQASDLDRLFLEQTSACILRRPRHAALADWLAAHTPTQCCERTAVVRTDDLDFSSLLRDFPSIGREPALRELEELCQLFAALVDDDRIGLRMTVTHQAQCPRFHIDRVPLRLICTWQGPGTEWLAHDDVNRRYLGAGNRGIADLQSGLLLPGACIHRLNAFDIAFFKGDGWPGHQGKAVVHRSPTLPTMGAHRVVVTLDVV